MIYAVITLNGEGMLALTVVTLILVTILGICYFLRIVGRSFFTYSIRRRLYKMLSEFEDMTDDDSWLDG